MNYAFDCLLSKDVSAWKEKELETFSTSIVNKSLVNDTSHLLNPDDPISNTYKL